MSHSSKNISLFGVLGALTLSLGMAGCASSPTPPPAAAAPPSEAFQRASAGVAESQGNPDDNMVFVEKEQKAPATHDDPPATGLNANQSAHPKN